MSFSSISVSVLPGVICICVGWDSSFGVVTCYGLDGRESNLGGGRDFLHLSRPAMVLTKTPIQWVSGLSLRGKAPVAWS
jgi:hypothetical protein